MHVEQRWYFLPSGFSLTILITHFDKKEAV
jgi:hypothetical protein